jgi:uncharacterized protein DUF998
MTRLARPHYLTSATPMVPWKEWIRKALLACGIVAPPLYVGATILGALVWKDYSPTAQSVSELFAVDAPSKSIMDPLLVIYSLLWIAFGSGVWLSAGYTLALRVAAIGLIGKELEGLIVQIYFPMHLRGVETTVNDPVHGVLTYTGVLFFLTAMGFGAAAFGPRWRVYSIGTLGVSLLFAVLTGLDIPRMAANLPTPWMGVEERITIFAYLLWGGLLALKLLRAPGERISGAAQEEDTHRVSIAGARPAA